MGEDSCPYPLLMSWALHREYKKYRLCPCSEDQRNRQGLGVRRADGHRKEHAGKWNNTNIRLLLRSGDLAFLFH